MAIIDTIVTVDISRETTAVDLASFDVPLILVEVGSGLSALLSDEIFTYTGIEGVASDFGVEHNAYKIAQKLLSGDLRPSTFKVGIKRPGSTYSEALTTCIRDDNGWYALLTDASLKEDIDAMASIIQSQRKIFVVSVSDPTALESNQTNVEFKALISLHSSIVGCEDGSTITLNIDGAIYQATKDIDVWGNFINVNTSASFESNGSSDITSTTLTLTSPDMFQVLSGNQSIIVNEDRGDGLQNYTDEYDISDSSIGDTTIENMDIGQQLHLKGYSRTAVMFSRTSHQDWPEAVWVGSQIVEVPGSNTWEYKQLPGVTVDRLTDNEVVLLESRGYNYYIPVKGVNITRRGKSVDGSWVDEIIVVDWLHARMQEQIFFRLVNRKKIPYTSQGFALIESEVRSVLDQAVTNGGVDTYSVHVPQVLSIPENIRAQRILDRVTFEARLAGAVSVVRVRGIVHN